MIRSDCFYVSIFDIQFSMERPREELYDPVFSHQFGRTVKEVPVAHIFGYTPNSQAVVLHVHGALPYFFVPQYDQNVSAPSFAAILENTAAERLSLQPDARILHHVEVVEGVPFYGYHDVPRRFYKVFVYNPMNITRLANLLGSTTFVGGRRWQPHENHLPFHLQLLADVGLCGMSFAKITGGKFRQPIIDYFDHDDENNDDDDNSNVEVEDVPNLDDLRKKHSKNRQWEELEDEIRFTLLAPSIVNQDQEQNNQQQQQTQNFFLSPQDDPPRSAHKYSLELDTHVRKFTHNNNNNNNTNAKVEPGASFQSCRNGLRRYLHAIGEPADEILRNAGIHDNLERRGAKNVQDADAFVQIMKERTKELEGEKKRLTMLEREADRKRQEWRMANLMGGVKKEEAKQEDEDEHGNEQTRRLQQQQQQQIDQILLRGDQRRVPEDAAVPLTPLSRPQHEVSPSTILLYEIEDKFAKQGQERINNFLGNQNNKNQQQSFGTTSSIPSLQQELWKKFDQENNINDKETKNDQERPQPQIDDEIQDQLDETRELSQMSTFGLLDELANIEVDGIAFELSQQELLTRIRSQGNNSSDENIQQSQKDLFDAVSFLSAPSPLGKNNDDDLSSSSPTSNSLFLSQQQPRLFTQQQVNLILSQQQGFRPSRSQIGFSGVQNEDDDDEDEDDVLDELLLGNNEEDEDEDDDEEVKVTNQESEDANDKEEDDEDENYFEEPLLIDDDDDDDNTEESFSSNENRLSQVLPLRRDREENDNEDKKIPQKPKHRRVTFSSQINHVEPSQFLPTQQQHRHQQENEINSSDGDEDGDEEEIEELIPPSPSKQQDKNHLENDETYDEEMLLVDDDEENNNNNNNDHDEETNLSLGQPSQNQQKQKKHVQIEFVDVDAASPLRNRNDHQKNKKNRRKSFVSDDDVQIISMHVDDGKPDDVILTLSSSSSTETPSNTSNVLVTPQEQILLEDSCVSQDNDDNDEQQQQQQAPFRRLQSVIDYCKKIRTPLPHQQQNPNPNAAAAAFSPTKSDASSSGSNIERLSQLMRLLTHPSLPRLTVVTPRRGLADARDVRADGIRKNRDQFNKQGKIVMVKRNKNSKNKSSSMMLNILADDANNDENFPSSSSQRTGGSSTTYVPLRLSSAPLDTKVCYLKICSFEGMMASPPGFVANPLTQKMVSAVVSVCDASVDSCQSVFFTTLNDSIRKSKVQMKKQTEKERTKQKKKQQIINKTRNDDKVAVDDGDDDDVVEILKNNNSRQKPIGINSSSSSSDDDDDFFRRMPAPLPQVDMREFETEGEMLLAIISFFVDDVNPDVIVSWSLIRGGFSSFVDRCRIVLGIDISKIMSRLHQPNKNNKNNNNNNNNFGKLFQDERGASSASSSGSREQQQRNSMNGRMASTSMMMMNDFLDEDENNPLVFTQHYSHDKNITNDDDDDDDNDDDCDNNRNSKDNRHQNGSAFQRMMMNNLRFQEQRDGQNSTSNGNDGDFLLDVNDDTASNSTNRKNNNNNNNSNKNQINNNDNNSSTRGGLAAALGLDGGNRGVSSGDAARSAALPLANQQLKIPGRIVMGLWKLVRSELKQKSYTIQAIHEALFHSPFPHIEDDALYEMATSFSDFRGRQCANLHLVSRSLVSLKICRHLDVFVRTAELAQIFGILFFEVLSRGSQFRVESVLTRFTKPVGFLAVSPTREQVMMQNRQEGIALVMEPKSQFCADPLLVLDFRSLYPSIVIAYNLCYSTLLGKVSPFERIQIGAIRSYRRPFGPSVDESTYSPNSASFVAKSEREGVLPKMLEEILNTRFQVQAAMKKAGAAGDTEQQRVFDAQQSGLKLLANVTYGYTAATFTGRMPCSDIADSIVLLGRQTLERAIRKIEGHTSWGATVEYADTDSMFVRLRGRTKNEAFKIGNEMVKAVNEDNPAPVTLKLEKVYLPSFLIVKKRYVGYSYEKPDQVEPKFDAKGIETVRRDQCPATSAILTEALRLWFDTRSEVRLKRFIIEQCAKLYRCDMRPNSLILRREVKLGTYANEKSLPPGARLAMAQMQRDPAAAPQQGERVAYCVVYNENNLLKNSVVLAQKLVEDPRLVPNAHHYVDKHIVPSLQRIFHLIGLDVAALVKAMPKSTKRRAWLFATNLVTWRPGTPIRPSSRAANNLARQALALQQQQLEQQQFIVASSVSRANSTVSTTSTAFGGGSSSKTTPSLHQFYQTAICAVCQDPTSKAITGQYGFPPVCFNCLSTPEKIGESLAQVYGRKRICDVDIEELNQTCRSCLMNNGCAVADEKKNRNNGNNNDNVGNYSWSSSTAVGDGVPDGGVNVICKSVDCDIRFDRQRTELLKEQYNLLTEFLSAKDVRNSLALVNNNKINSGSSNNMILEKRRKRNEVVNLVDDNTNNDHRKNTNNKSIVGNRRLVDISRVNDETTTRKAEKKKNEKPEVVHLD